MREDHGKTVPAAEDLTGPILFRTKTAYMRQTKIIPGLPEAS